MRKRNELRVLLVAQTPPPFGGQAVLMQHIRNAKYDGVRIFHVRMAFSRDMGEMGRIRLRKIGHLLALLYRISWARLRYRPVCLYYPPAGRNKVAMYRDVFLLISSRWMFRRTIFHFLAGGLSELYPVASIWMKPLFRAAYYGADLGIRTDPLAPEDPKSLKVRAEMIIPNAVEDAGVPPVPSDRLSWRGDKPTILYVGVMRESKGVVTLLDACGLLKRQGHEFRLRMMGQFDSHSFERRVAELGSDYDLAIEHLGVRIGREMHAAFEDADIFAYPTYFESEAFPLVLIEAMQHRLPIVTTNWRSIPSMVSDGSNGFVVSVRDPEAVADRIARLLKNPALAISMGRFGRKRYEDFYTMTAFDRRLQQAFDQIRSLVT
jgi:glycosyltransferase involved in cell wall biosynthesis